MRECWLREWSPLSIDVIILDTVHQCLDISEYFIGGAHVTYSRTTGCRKSWLAIWSWLVVGMCWQFLVCWRSLVREVSITFSIQLSPSSAKL